MSGKSGKCQENQEIVRKIRKLSGKSGNCQENVRKIRKMSGKSGNCQESPEIVRKKFDSGKSGNCQEKIRFRKIRKFVRKSQSEPCKQKITQGSTDPWRQYACAVCRRSLRVIFCLCPTLFMQIF